MSNWEVHDDLGEYLDVLRIDEETWRSLVMECQRRVGTRYKNKRASERNPLWSTAPMRIVVTHPGGNVARFRVRPHNLSEGGLAFFHGQFLHRGSPVESVISVEGVEREIVGHVTFCRLVRGRIHEVGVQFDQTSTPSTTNAAS